MRVTCRRNKKIDSTMFRAHVIALAEEAATNLGKAVWGFYINALKFTITDDPHMYPYSFTDSQDFIVLPQFKEAGVPAKGVLRDYLPD